MSGLQFGPLPNTTLHVCVDMQRMFAEGTSWAGSAVKEAMPGVLVMVGAMPAATVFTRFITPQRVEDAHGAWRGYYERYHDVTQDVMDPALLDLAPPLQALAKPGMVVDKTAYGAFGTPAFEQFLAAWRPTALVFTGIETEVCVLATLMGAIDRGYRCVLASDGVSSCDADAHGATMTTLQKRLSQQLEVALAAEIVDGLRPAR